ncbi:Nucleobase-ascorbate transporter 7 [Hibiscus syriacus]|uniref:Nucleobase-ascorbate transporter 7 n=1 Tax=Hibiscus syriacus TaxID=106335 RepID=A0A6A2Z9C6_HIBSY|nr:Nucleobase-ascorbate transporter 7 [Hibiscus syriacus]
MGNCQAIDAAALVIQHPCGKMERLYWPVPNREDEAVRFTRVKLLRPGDTLALGHAFRLVTSHEVMEILKAKKYAKTKRKQHLESSEKLQHEQDL